MTALVVVLAFVAGCITAVIGVWVGRGQSTVSLLLDWGALTLVLQLFAACIAIVHARASGQRAAAELAAPGDDATTGSSTVPRLPGA